MGLGFSYTFGLDKPSLSAALQALNTKPGVSDLDLGREIGVGGKKGIAYSAWLLYLGLRETAHRELSKLGALILENDPYLNKPLSLLLLHYQLCSNPNATVWWALANKVIPRNNEISVDKAVETLTSLGVGVNNLKNLRSDVGVFFATYRAARIFGSLNYLNAVGENTYVPAKPEPPPLLLAYILYSKREGNLRTSTTSLANILSEDGQIGKVFLLTRTSLLEALRQLEFKGFVTIAQVADLENIGYTYDGKALDILKMCYEEGK